MLSFFFFLDAFDFALVFFFLFSPKKKLTHQLQVVAQLVRRRVLPGSLDLRAGVVEGRERGLGDHFLMAIEVFFFLFILMRSFSFDCACFALGWSLIFVAVFERSTE